jgi:hypothetical protein
MQDDHSLLSVREPTFVLIPRTEDCPNFESARICEKNTRQNIDVSGDSEDWKILLLSMEIIPFRA